MDLWLAKWAAFAAMLWERDALVLILLALMLVDLVVRASTAWRDNAWDPEAMRRAIITKWLTLMVVLACWLVAKMVPLVWPAAPEVAKNVPLMDGACIAFGLVEAVSILANAKVGGVSVPQLLFDALRALKRLWTGNQEPDQPEPA